MRCLASPAVGACIAIAVLLSFVPFHCAHAAAKKSEKSSKAAKQSAPAKRAAPANRDGQAEARLIEIYKLIGQAKTRPALALAEKLVSEHPNFQLAQLVYGDLLTAQQQPLRMLGNVADTQAQSGAVQLAELRKESLLRIQALQAKPAPGTLPSQFLNLSPQNKHAIAIDTARARLYLFENTATGMTLLGDYYISVGKSGIEKTIEGDLRTPLGIYFVTSNLSPKSLKDFYGSGALPINYPNQLDMKRGKTGSGIWLHGTPPDQFSRAPLSTDGCVVLANPDLERIIRTVQIRTTPVVIAKSLQWVAPQSLQTDSAAFEENLKAWAAAKSSSDMAKLMAWYAPEFNSFGKTLAAWTPTLQAEVKKSAGRGVQLKDVSYLRWKDASDTMVVTFAELNRGSAVGVVKRQYWTRQGSQWKIFFEGVIG